MRVIVTLLGVVLAAAPAVAQEYELANALAERGWYDLSEELFTRITNTGSLSAEQKAEGEYGLARINIMRAERAESTEEKNKLFEKAIEGIEAFRKKFPSHRLAGEALSDIGYLYQAKGKALVAAAKADPGKLDEAEKAFGAAEKLFQDLISELKKKPVARPEDEKNLAAIDAFQAYEEKLMFAKYNYALALFSHAETFKENTSKHPDMKRLLEAMNKFLNDDFMWEYEQYLLAYDAFIYMGRAYQILAETSDREKAEDYWRQCFVYLGKPRSLLTDKEARKNDAVKEIAGRAILFEMKARGAYGDVKRGQAATAQFNGAVKLAEEFFKQSPNSRFEDTGKAIRLEQGRLLCKAGQTKQGIDLLTDLSKANKDSWVENIAIDILGEYGADRSPGLAYEAGRNYRERGPAYLYRAIQKYRKALQAIRRPEDQKYVSLCWYEIGECYYYLDRWHEAVAALSAFEKPPLQSSPEASQAALLKLQSLGRIAKVTKDKGDEKAVEDYRAYVTRTYPDAASAQLLRQAAIDLEAKQKFLEASKEWEKLAQPGKSTHEEALFSIGFNLYRAGDQSIDQSAKQRGPEKEKLVKVGLEHWTRALEAFKRHLDFVDKQAAKDPRMVKNAIGSVMFACRILTNDRVDKGAEALAVSENIDKRFPNADPRLVIAIMSLRIDAKVRAGQVEEAESDLRALQAKFEQEQIGLEHYSRALTVLAGAFMAEAAKQKDKDAEKYDAYGMKAANYYLAYYQLNPTSIRGNLDQMEAMAQMLFVAAEQRLKAGQAKNDKAVIEEAKKHFASARELYSEFLLQREQQLVRTESGREQRRAIKARITKCLLASGQYDEAIKELETIVKDDTQMRDGSTWEDLADCYAEKGKVLPKGIGDRAKMLKDAEGIYSRLASMLMSNQVFNEHTYRLLYKRAAILLETDPDMLASFYKNMELRNYHPRWDADDKGVSRWGFQARFTELQKELEKIVPKR